MSMINNKKINMRDIKFRAWDIAYKKWLEQKEVYEEVAEQGMWNPERSEYFHIMQYTGLKDKNGKEIYEGDIVMKETYSRGYWLPVVWKEAMFAVGESGLSPLYKSDAKYYEVIGNIYENPSLLTQ